MRRMLFTHCLCATTTVTGALHDERRGLARAKLASSRTLVALPKTGVNVVTTHIAIVLPSYNHLDFAANAIHSVMRGSTPDDDVQPLVFIVDDASPDWYSVDDKKSSLVITSAMQKYPHGCLNINRFLTHGGLTRSWNKGLVLARAHAPSTRVSPIRTCSFHHTGISLCVLRSMQATTL